jgi:hypothetical protein
VRLTYLLGILGHADTIDPTLPKSDLRMNHVDTLVAGGGVILRENVIEGAPGQGRGEGARVGVVEVDEQLLMGVRGHVISGARVDEHPAT